MTAAAVIFCSTLLIAWLEGFTSPAFARIAAGDAFSDALPFLGILLVARFALRRMPARQQLVHRGHAAAQGLLAGMSFGWWWVEPHAFLVAHSPGSLAAMAWQAAAGAFFGLLVAIAAERSRQPQLVREIAIGAFVAFLLAGGRAYRAFDHVEAGTRLAAATAIAATVVAIALASWLLLRRRPRAAAAIPALAPALAALLLLVSPLRASIPTELSSRDSVLLIVVDTLRADIADGHFPEGGDAMPELRRIAEGGVRFTQAVSPAPWTLPATVSLLGGWNPHRHHYGRSVSAWEVLPGDPAAMHLASTLRDSGYLTAAFVHNPYLRPYFGFSNGFYTMRPYHGRAIDGVALALDWIGSHASLPSFTMLHLMDPHWPYEAPPGFGPERQACGECDNLFDVQYGNNTPAFHAEIERRYSAEVRYTDAMIGRLVDALGASGALDHCWLVITSDHGEEFWDHGQFMHGHTLYDELLHVPLVVVPPRADRQATRGVRIDTQVRLEDVSATLLEIAGADTALARDGRSLLPLLAGKADGDTRVSVGGLVKSTKDLSWSVRRPPWKNVYFLGGGRSFRIDRDPGEKHDLYADKSLSAAERSEVQTAFRWMALAPKAMGFPVSRTPAPPSDKAPDADTRRQLRSLGYAD